MRNLRKGVGTLATVAALSSAAMMVVNCSGDDTGVGDGGPDSSLDTSPQPDVKTDTNPQPDAKSDVVEGGGLTVAQYAASVGVSFCTRFQSCCNTSSDAGPFDVPKCEALATANAWQGSNSDIVNPEIVARNNMTVNQVEAQSCLAGLGTISCPIAPSTEVVTLSDNCFAAVEGTLSVGGACISSVECKSGNYCLFAGSDAGTTDAGTAQGRCAPLVAQGQPCGQNPPYNATFLSTECAYRGWQSPPEFCDYDTYPDAGGYACQPLRGNGATCYFDNECSSGMCGVIGQSCSPGPCTCLTTRDYSSVCKVFAIKDAGPG